MSHFWASGLAYDAVMFDFAGVLVPLDRIGEAAFASAVGPYGVDPIQHLAAFNLAWNRTSPNQTVELLLARILGDGAAVAAFREFNEEFTRRTLTAPEVPGATAILQGLKAAHVPAALISYAPRAVLERQLHVRGWDDYFEKVFSREQFTAPRPDPSGYRTLTVSMRTNLDRALAIERTSTGVMAARLAGLAVVHLGCANEARCNEDTEYHALDLHEVANEVLRVGVS